MNLKKLCLVVFLSSPTLFVLAQKGDVTASAPQKDSKTAAKSKDKKADKTEDKSETITDKKVRKTSDKSDKKKPVNDCKCNVDDQLSGSWREH